MHDLCHVFFHLYSVRVLIVCYPEAFNTVSYYIQLNVQPEKKKSNNFKLDHECSIGTMRIKNHF